MEAGNGETGVLCSTESGKFVLHIIIQIKSEINYESNLLSIGMRLRIPLTKIVRSHREEMAGSHFRAMIPRVLSVS